MGKRILFSPVGGTDPIRNCHDGSMLHICRHYKPDIVYLYLSHEMMDFHKKDNRYIDAVNRLGAYLKHSFDVKLIERDELINVQEYDIFYKDFREEIKIIERQLQKDDELLINMASGTPAMKSALVVMAALAEYRFKPIQVSTPQKGINPAEKRDVYDAEVEWELNEDNEKGAENRCKEVKCYNLLKLLKIEEIKKHIRAYDYAAALTVAKEIEKDISEKAYRMIQIADARIKLDQRSISALTAGQDYDIYPIKEGDKKKIFEYALVLQIKVEKQELADFVRGITPLVVDLLENILKKECGVKLKDCCRVKVKSGEEFYQWDRKKLQKKGLLEMLDKDYKGYFREEPVYSHHIKTIICSKCKDDLKLVEEVNNILKVEGAVRNVAAHEIVSVTDEWITDKTSEKKKIGKIETIVKPGKTAQQILEIIRYLIIKSGVNVKEEYWKSYDKMNDTIKMYLDM